MRAPARASEVFLVGPARSGTSLVYKALCLHPDAAYISNWLARAPRLRALAALNRLVPRFPAKRSTVWFGDGSSAYAYGRPRGLRDKLVPMPVEGEPLYASCGIGMDGPVGPEGAAAEALRRSFAALRRYSGGRVVVSKRIANNRRIPFLANAFPGARFVSLVRDGRAVAYSLARVDWWEDAYLPWYGGTPRQWRERGGDPWEACALNWVHDLRDVEEGLGAVPDEAVMRLRYEELIADPLPTIRRVGGFAGLGPSDEWEMSLEGLRFPDRNEAWRTGLDAKAVETVTRVQASELEAHGYGG